MLGVKKMKSRILILIIMIAAIVMVIGSVFVNANQETSSETLTKKERPGYTEITSVPVFLSISTQPSSIKLQLSLRSLIISAFRRISITPIKTEQTSIFCLTWKS